MIIKREQPKRLRKSDDGVVPEKLCNAVEKRPSRQQPRCEDTRIAPRSEEPVGTKLQRIATRARADRNAKFTSLYHLLNKPLLLECFTQLKDKAASGIDKVTKAKYGENLDNNLTDLVRRLHQMSYRPQPVRRVYIPKPGSHKQRPLGVPSLEDKLVQSALVKILESIYEQDFIDDSYGFRPGKGCHDALRALSQTVENGPVNMIVEADIKGFFDQVDQDLLMRFIGHRIADKRIHRLIKRILKAGIQEDGQHRASDRGTPQGGVISPLLANIYLHYTLDLWFEKRVKRACRGHARMIRYADDYVVCFQNEAEAKTFMPAMVERLKKFGLEVAPEKTKLLAFGPYAQKRAKAQGQRTATFDFLGFTHYCSRSRNAKRYRMKRKTVSKRLSAKVVIYKEWIKANRTLTTAQIMKITAAKLRGHYAYYGVTDNIKSLGSFKYHVTRTLFKWLNRRGKRGCYTWVKFDLLVQRYPLPNPSIRVNLFSS